jgi:putative restriction endonuclease
MERSEAWLQRICNLKVYKAAHGQAPHKPLLLLVVLDLVEMGQLADGTLELTPELAFRFSVYGGVVAHRRSQTLQVRFPFFHLQSDGFWQALDEQREPTTDRKSVRYEIVDPEFLSLARDPSFREQARYLLIAKYFPEEERAALYSLCNLEVPDEDEIARHAEYQPLIAAKEKGRDARFRIVVLHNFNFTCAMTGYRLMTSSAGCIVDAAHIHQYVASKNNDPRNGLALSKNAHWLFDNGLWTLSDDYRVIVAKGCFDEERLDPGIKLLIDYHDNRIHLPLDESNWPDIQYVKWHRKNRFKGRSA